MPGAGRQDGRVGGSTERGTATNVEGREKEEAIDIAVVGSTALALGANAVPHVLDGAGNEVRNAARGRGRRRRVVIDLQSSGGDRVERHPRQPLVAVSVGQVRHCNFHGRLLGSGRTFWYERGGFCRRLARTRRRRRLPPKLADQTGSTSVQHPRPALLHPGTPGSDVDFPRRGVNGAAFVVPVATVEDDLLRLGVVGDGPGCRRRPQEPRPGAMPRPSADR